MKRPMIPLLMAATVLTPLAAEARPESRGHDETRAQQQQQDRKSVV